MLNGGLAHSVVKLGGVLMVEQAALLDGPDANALPAGDGFDGIDGLRHRRTLTELHTRGLDLTLCPGQ